jgi:hypothetical protein
MTKQPKDTAEKFYKESLMLLIVSGIPFFVGGTHALTFYTGIQRQTKDIDIFCKPGDYTRILSFFADKGYETEIVDARWLAKITKNTYFVDIIFGSRTDLTTVDETWFTNIPEITMFDMKIKIMAIEELIWSKTYIQHRDKYDGVDINHLILRQGKNINWKHLLMRMDGHWEILFAHILNFRFVYPSERNIIPDWLIEEFITRISHQLKLPPPTEKICRGHLITDGHYQIDINEWGFLSVNSQKITYGKDN